MFQHEHFASPYRILAALELPLITQCVASILHTHSAKKNFTAKDISSYLGDCLECYYRNHSDPHNKRDTIVLDFCAQWEVNSTGSAELQEIFMGLERVAHLEVPLAPQVSQFQCVYEAADLKPHSWLKNMPYIGGGRAIHHTLRLLQAFGHIVHDTPNDKRIEPRRGFFGKTPWRPGQTHKIPGDLDELLMSDILPQWVIMCRHGILGIANLPRQDELCPLFVLIKTYVDHPERPVTWSITFAVHALLTAILETDRIADKLSADCKDVFEGYFNQLKWAQRIVQQEPDSLESPVWSNNMALMFFLENLGLPVFGSRALWNPLCAGTILSYLTFFGNLEVGCALIDCHAQLRIVLHLFHALLINGILCQGDIPYLDMLHAAFQNSKAIWEGPLPRKGELVQRFWICFGSSFSDARQMAEEAQRGISTRESRPESQSRNKNRKLSPIEAAKICKSYRRICNRDFHDVVDKYHTPEQRQRSKGTDQYHLAVRTNDTLDAIENEVGLLSLNFPAAGAALEQIVCSLGRVLQWEPLLTREIGIEAALLGTEQMKRQGFAYLFAQHVLGALDFAEDPRAYKFLDIFVGEATASFMSEFFSRLGPRMVMWFQATREED